MATIPIGAATVNVFAGSKESRNILTNDFGLATTYISMTQSEYEALQGVRAEALKGGYIKNESNVTSLPPWNVAIINGIDMSIVLEKELQNKFTLNPESLRFDIEHGGGTKTITVTCPDGTWEVYSFDSRMTCSKTSNTLITATVPPDSPSGNYDPIRVRWFDSSINSWQYRDCACIVSSSTASRITFNLNATATGGASVAGAKLKLYMKSNNDSYLTDVIGDGTVDSSGNCVIYGEFDQNQWNSYISNGFNIAVIGKVDGFDTSFAQLDTIPVWGDAQENGVSITNILFSNSTETKEFAIGGSVNDQNNNPVDTIVNGVTQNTKIVLFNGVSQGGAYWSSIRNIKYGDYMQIKTEGVLINTGSEKRNNGGPLEPKSTYFSGTYLFDWVNWPSTGGRANYPDITVTAL